MSRAIDDLVEYLLQHIALAGSQGVSPPDLEHLVQNFYPKDVAVPPTSLFPLMVKNESPAKWAPLVDSFLMERVWVWLARRPEVLIGLNNQYSHLSLSEAKILHAENSSTPFPPVTTPSRPTKKARTAKNEEISDESQRAGSANTGPIRIYTTEDRMWLAVCGHGVDHKSVPPLEFTLLSIIASNGSAGLAQTELTRLSGQDKRSLPKRTDNLSKKGYVIKKSIINRGTRTSLLTLRRFIDGSTDLNHPSLPGAPGHGFPGQSLLSADGQIHLDRVVDVIYDILKDAKTLPVETIKQRLGYNRLTWPKRFLLGALRKLAMIGLIVRIKVKVEYSSLGKSVLTKAIKLIRAPTVRDRELFLTIGEQEARVNDFHQLKTQQGSNDSSDESDTEVDVSEPPAEGQALDESTALELAARKSNSAVVPIQSVPQWDPDLPLTHMIFCGVTRADQGGISSMDLRSLLFGSFWRRPFDTLMARLTDAWEKSQPPHLEHFVIIKDTAMTNKQVHFTYRTAFSYSHLVNSGQTVWEAVMSGTAQEASPLDQALSVYQHSWGAVDQWGLPLVRAEFLVNGNGLASLSQMDKYARERCHRPIREIKDSLLNTGPTPTGRKRARANSPLESNIPSIPSTPQITSVLDSTHGSTGRLLSKRESEKRSKAMALRIEDYRRSLRPWAERLVGPSEPEVSSGEGSSSQLTSSTADGRKRRKIVLDDTDSPIDITPSGSQESPSERNIETVIDNLFEMKYPGVYIGHPSAVRVFSRGRPRSQLVVVIKSDKLQTIVIPSLEINPNPESISNQTPVTPATPGTASIGPSETSIAQMLSSPNTFSPTPSRRKADRMPSIPEHPALDSSASTSIPVAKSSLLAASARSHPEQTLPLATASTVSIPKIVLSNNAVASSPASVAVAVVPLFTPARTSTITAAPLSVPTGSAETSSPTPASRTHKKNGGLFIGGGLMGFNRTRILLELITKCGGVAPGGSELYQSFRDVWIAKYAGCQPDTKTMNRAILFASQSAQLIRFPFTFTDANNVEVTKYVITLPGIDQNDPRVKEVQGQMQRFHPDHYMPPPLGLGQKKRNIVFRDHYVLDSTAQLDPQANVPLWVQRHMENMRSIAELRQSKQLEREQRQHAKLSQMGTARRRAKAERAAWAPFTGPRPLTTPTVESGQDASMSDSSVDPSLVNIDPQLWDGGSTSQDYVVNASSTVQTLSVRRERIPTILSLETEQARDRLHFRKQIQTLFMPFQTFIPILGIFGTFPVTDGRKLSGWSRAQNKPRSSSFGVSGELTDGGQPASWQMAANVPYITCNPRQTKHEATGTFVDAIPMSTVNRRKQPVRFAPRVSKRIIPALPTSHRADSELQDYSSSSFAQAINTQGPPRKRRARRTIPGALLAAVTGDRSSLVSSLKATTPSYRTKNSQIAVPVLDEKTRLLLIIITIVQIVAGGVSMTINWAIVQKICDCFPHLAFPKELPRLAYRWRCISKSHEWIVDEFSSQFRDAYLKAYVAHEVDRLDYNSLTEYNWIKLVTWVNNTIDLNSIITQSIAASLAGTDSTVLLASMQELEERYEIEVTGSSGLSALPETFYNIKSLHTLRSVRIHETRFSDSWSVNTKPTHSLTPSSLLAGDPRRIVYSITRASVATPELAYAPEEASRRLSALPIGLIELALRDLMKRGLMTKMHAGGAVAPGRNWRLSDVFWSTFDRTVTRKMFVEAARFKRGLDRLFMMGQRPMMQIGDTVPDGHILALINLIAQGQCALEPIIPKSKGIDRPPEFEPDFAQFSGSFISRWGWLGDRYQTRRMDRSLMYIPIQIVPTKRYMYSREGKGGVTAEMGNFELDPPDIPDMDTSPALPSPGLNPSGATVPSRVASSSSSSYSLSLALKPTATPIWRDIHGALNRPIWFRLVSALAQIISGRPGINLPGILVAFKDMLEDWEIKACLDWMVRAGIVAWETNAEVNDSVDSNGLRSRSGGEGLRVQEWWWLAPAVWSDEAIDEEEEEVDPDHDDGPVVPTIGTQDSLLHLPLTTSVLTESSSEDVRSDA